MNEHLFFQLINPWIAIKDLPICLNHRSREKVGKKRIHCIKQRLFLDVDIYVHTGSPCYRYCICKYFSHTDKMYVYKQ